MIDREELNSHFEWLAGSRWYDQALGEAALAIELAAHDHGGEWMRYGYSWMCAAAVVEVLGLEAFVDEVSERRAQGKRFPASFPRRPEPVDQAVPRNR